ncbi:MAG: ribonuclease HI family protein [Xylophilus ampelinus]
MDADSGSPTPRDGAPAPVPAWTLHCDGSAQPNPGRMGLGAVMAAPDGVRHTLSVATQCVGCNNEAELRAFVLALESLRARGAAAVEAYSDNSILVELLSRPGAPPPARLAELVGRARALWAGFADARLRWIPRHRNGEADALARAALGMPPKPAAPPSPRRKRRR